MYYYSDGTGTPYNPYTERKYETADEKVTEPLNLYSASPCKSCGCNPMNGGSGICNCTLNMPEITC